MRYDRMDNSITNRNRLQTQMIDIQDKRNYAINYPTTNIVINQALAVSSNALSNDELAQTIRNLCANNNDALINVALNLAPSYSVSEIIWQTLHRAINSNNDHTLTGACLFAIPIILVAGSKNPQILNSSLDNQLIADFFAQQQIINLPTSNWFISGKLVDAKTIATFSPSQYYFWARNIDNAKLWLPVDIPANPIRVHNEGVCLRYVL